MSEVMTANQDAQPSAFGGVFIITGTSIGAGMFSLPVLTSNMWFGWAVLFLCVSWYCMYSSALYLLEANQKFKHGVNFDSMTKALLPTSLRMLNGLSVLFVSYILVYAYISGGGSMLGHSLQSGLGINIDQSVASFVFAVLLGLIVSFSTKAVDRFTSAMLGGMVITFSIAIYSLLSGADFSLLQPLAEMTERLPYSWAAIPSLMVCFGFHSNIPSLVKYYNKDSSKVVSSIRYGSLLALTIYLIWLLASFTVIGRDGFASVIAAGGNMGALVSALESAGSGATLAVTLQLFANFAVATSFLGVALGLFDFLTDLLKLDDTLSGRSKTALVTFVPPMIGGVLFPNGFIYAIGYAGFAAAVFALFTPVALAFQARKHLPTTDFLVPGGHARMVAVLAFAVCVVSFQVLSMMGLLA
ncbi:aromatic amino acid transport family protein [Moritella sp. F3]|uniref:aromatic amino acid transport family protein n=1 Tax=Moritella sp. F3 TaxID=2718882 RepID=UPI0018E126F7|nr:aromatic amino acid transport family protein [Moritella sp. F3]GIC76382.1 high affinity tryptophan transporter Mtr [Moritella sp. F1]GIC80949.1 high affinity tryptophan transporter Mtr [Moritella sp. F3]